MTGFYKLCLGYAYDCIRPYSIGLCMLAARIMNHLAG